MLLSLLWVKYIAPILCTKFVVAWWFVRLAAAGLSGGQAAAPDELLGSAGRSGALVMSNEAAAFKQGRSFDGVCLGPGYPSPGSIGEGLGAAQPAPLLGANSGRTQK